VQCSGIAGTNSHYCVYHPVAGTYNPVYFMDTEYMNWLVWEGGPGDLVTQETYIKGPAGLVNGRRMIGFSDNHSVADKTWLTNFPNNLTPPTSCALNGQVSPCTAVEQKTAMDYQHSIVANDVDYPLRKTSGITLRSCIERWTGYIGPPPNASVVWNANTCSHELRVEIKCENPVSHFTVYQYGGWVQAVGLHSGSTCSPNENHLAAAYGQYRNGDGQPITTVRYF
jgi:hypothetical protein